MEIKIKLFDEICLPVKAEGGDWYDLFASKDVFVPSSIVKPILIPRGIAVELPEGYEAHIVPRSSTFKTWGIIQTNHMGVIDESYNGDNDQWRFPAYCLCPKTCMDGVLGSFIHRGDKICQFRIMEHQPEFNFVKVDSLGNADRGGFGSTGTT